MEHFKKAVDLDPDFPTARLYLATAYMSQYIPGADRRRTCRRRKRRTTNSRRCSSRTRTTRSPPPPSHRSTSTRRRLDEAKQWYRKLIAISPKNKEAYYTLGVIAWTRTVPAPHGSARQDGHEAGGSGAAEGQKGPGGAEGEDMPVIEEGIKNLEQALQIDPEYDDAMAYLNLLHRERADLEDNPEEYKKETDIADNWVQKTLETKKIKAERKPVGGGITTETK